MVICGSCNVMSEAVQSTVVHIPIFLKCITHMLLNVRTILMEKIIFFPVIQHAGFYCLLIICTVRTPDYDISEVSGFHTCLVYTVLIRNNVYDYIEFVF